MTDWKRKLSSRKLWMAIAGFVAGLIMAFGGNESQASTVSGVILQGAAILGYLLAEGAADAAGAYFAPTEYNEEDADENS